MEDERALRFLAHVHAVEREGVDVYIEPQGRVRALHDGDGAGVREGYGGEAELTLGAVFQRARDLADEPECTESSLLDGVQEGLRPERSEGAPKAQ